jgi:1,4-dihydroxy-2-naphthoate octaprenyltransferase
MNQSNQPSTPPPTPALELLRISHPWVLLLSLLTFALGAGIANYLGSPIYWPTYITGQAAVILLLLSSYFLREFFDRPAMLELPRQPGDPPRLLRSHLFIVTATTLTIGAVLTVLLLARGALNPSAFLALGIAFLIAMAYALPPLRLAHSGYGELVTAIFIANLTPALAFLLQYGEFHRLLAFVTFPLTFLILASALALRMESYVVDMHADGKNMLTRLGWQRGITIHNILILTGFLLLGTAALAGLPWSLTWPGLLGLPFGLFQILQMQAIANGAKPRWRLLAITAAATIALTTYFLNLALWTV